MLETQLTRRERRSLKQLAELDGVCDVGVLPEAHLERFMALGLVAMERDRYCLTPVGQILAVRQQFVLKLSDFCNPAWWRRAGQSASV